MSNKKFIIGALVIIFFAGIVAGFFIFHIHANTDYDNVEIAREYKRLKGENNKVLLKWRRRGDE